MSNNKKIIFLSILFGLWFSVSIVTAVELKYNFPCSGLPGATCPSETETGQSPAAYIARFYQFALAIAGILAFGMIIFGAIQYTVSAGNVSKQSDARDRIFQALWGVALILGAWLILYTIDPKLVSLTDPGITNLVPSSSLSPLQEKKLFEDFTKKFGANFGLTEQEKKDFAETYSTTSLNDLETKKNTLENEIIENWKEIDKISTKEAKTETDYQTRDNLVNLSVKADNKLDLIDAEIAKRK